MTDREWDIDFRRIWLALRRGGLCILALGMEGVLAALLGTLLLSSPQYRSAVVFHSTGNRPTAAYQLILKSRQTLETVVGFAGVGRTWQELEDMVSLRNLDPSEFFEVTVTSPDPREAELIADGVAQVLPVQIGELWEGASAEAMSSAIGSAEEIPPETRRNALLGGAAGLLLGLTTACLEGVMDTVIRRKSDLELLSRYPVLSVISGTETWGPGTRLLRAKLAHLLAEKPGAHILGITSTLPGEGAGSLAEQLAASLKKQGKRVLLVDCDLGRSGTQAPGLADYLAGRGELCRMIQRRTLSGASFVVIPPGKSGEKGAELLASPEMAALLEKCRGGYDAVILQLPAMTEPETVLSLTGQLDGLLFCVRRDVCCGPALENAIAQLEFVEAPILGLVYQDFSPGEKKEHRPAKLLASVKKRILG